MVQIAQDAPIRGDRTKCPRREYPGLKQTRIRVKVTVKVRFTVIGLGSGIIDYS